MGHPNVALLWTRIVHVKRCDTSCKERYKNAFIIIIISIIWFGLGQPKSQYYFSSVQQRLFSR